MAPAVRHQRVEVVQAGEGEARNWPLNDDLARDGMCVWMSAFPSQRSRWGPRPIPLSNLQRNPDSACIERARMKCFTGKQSIRHQQSPSCPVRANLTKLAKLGTELLGQTLGVGGRKECGSRFLGETPVGWQCWQRIGVSRPDTGSPC